MSNVEKCQTSNKNVRLGASEQEGLEALPEVMTESDGADLHDGSLLHRLAPQTLSAADLKCPFAASSTRDGRILGLL